MNKKQKIRLLVFCVLFICIMLKIGEYIKETAQVKTVRGFEADYTYYDRRLSVGDFEQFGYDSTYEEISECLGAPNGSVSTNMSLPYYELKDGRFAVCSYTQKKFIYIANDKNIEYYLLPAKLKEKSEALKRRAVVKARQYELNVILDMLQIQDWKSTTDEFSDIPMGEYTYEKLRQYTENDNTADISYYFGSYHESVQLPLIQIVQIYEEQNLIYFGYALWDTDLDWQVWYIEDDAKYREDGEDHIEQVEKCEIKSQKELLNINIRDKDFDDIDLLPQNIAYSLTEYLVKQKIIRDRRNSRVEFWGDDENGKYVCLISVNPRKIGWEIDEDDRRTGYYFVTMDTLDDNIMSINVVQLDRRL